MNTLYSFFESPVGPLLLMSDGAALTGLHTESDKYRPKIRSDWMRDDDAIPFATVKAQLRDYFEGRLTEFDLPLNPRGTAFQMRVWEKLCGIPFGETISYAELARRIGNPNASRAVGMANSRNPVSIIVPCHRVIGADNSLTGYAGGLDRKRALLEHEMRWRPHAHDLFGAAANAGATGRAAGDAPSRAMSSPHPRK
jgi:methylated-DNA-[protein]-cysteine S-methyltransferase